MISSGADSEQSYTNSGAVMLGTSGQFGTEYTKRHLAVLPPGYIAVEAGRKDGLASGRRSLVHITVAVSFGDVAKRIKTIRAMCGLKVSEYWSLVPRRSEEGTGRFLISCPNCRAQLGKALRGETDEQR